MGIEGLAGAVSKGRMSDSGVADAAAVAGAYAMGPSSLMAMSSARESMRMPTDREVMASVAACLQAAYSLASSKDAQASRPAQKENGMSAGR
jgi:hypothetical protein